MANTETSLARIIGNAEIRNFMGYDNESINLNHIFDSGSTLLTTAIRKSDLPAVNSLVTQGASVNQREQGGATPLLLATHLNELQIVEFLLNHGASVNVGDSYDSPITVAVRKGHLKIIECLLDKGANVNMVNIDGMLPIFWAIEQERVDILKLLISRGIPEGIKDAAGDSPLIAAVKRQSSKEIIQCLLKNGAEICEAAMIWAASKGHLNVMEILIKNGADARLVTSDGNTLLAIAVRYRQFEIVKHLINSGVSVGKVGKNGRTPLLWAIQNTDLEMTEYLIQHDAFYIINGVFLDAIKTRNLQIVQLLYTEHNKTSPNVMDLKVPLETALDVESFDITKYLLHCGATFASLGIMETAYLLGFIEKKNYEMVELFIENDANLNYPYPDHTPLTKAVETEDMRIIENLIRHQVNVNLENLKSWTPLAIAASRQNFQIFEYLVLSGANIDEDPRKDDADLRLYYYMAKDKILKERQLYLESLSNQTEEKQDDDEELGTEDDEKVAERKENKELVHAVLERTGVWCRSLCLHCAAVVVCIILGILSNFYFTELDLN